MIYPLEKLEAEAAAYRAAARILFDARDVLEEGATITSAVEAVKAVKEVYILRGVKVATDWAIKNVPAFVFDSIEAAGRVKRIIEQEQSGDAALDALCDQYREQRGARQRRQHDPYYLLQTAEKLERAARLMKEGQQIRKEQNLPAADENGIIKAVKERYIETQSAVKVSEWAFDNIQGFSLTKNKAKERVDWIIDAEQSGEAALDIACEKVRKANRKKAGIMF